MEEKTDKSTGVLYLIGLGLSTEQDITVRGLQVVKRCKHVYLEGYTSILGVEKSKLEEFYGREVELMDREAVESNSDEMLLAARTAEVAFLVVGDVYGATTHTDIALRAKEMGIRVEVIHNASIMNACGACGLQLYNFGQTVSLCFWTESWQPDSYIDKILLNKRNGMHTLCLLDIKVKEQSEENLIRGRKIFEPPRFMTVNQALEQLEQIVRRREDVRDVLDLRSTCVGLARVGQETQCIASGPLEELKSFDFGPPLHSLIIPAEMHPLEIDMLRSFNVVGGEEKEEKEKEKEAQKQEGKSNAGQEDSLGALALKVLLEGDADKKAEETLSIGKRWADGLISNNFPEKSRHSLPSEPCRPQSVQMVDARKVKQGSKASFVHSLCHAESYAIDLMWDLMLRFSDEDLPKEFYDDWIKVASDEARHYSIWRDRLSELGSSYGDFPAHNSLWESASETSHDLLARLAIVHMVHEARGLDVAHAALSRFQKENPPDVKSAQILENNVRDETTHVGAAVKWFKYVCEKRRLGDPVKVYHDYVKKYFRGVLKPPFNKQARLEAGMTEDWYLPLAGAENNQGEEKESAGKENKQEDAGGKEEAKGKEEEEEEEDDMLKVAGEVDSFFEALNS